MLVKVSAMAMIRCLVPVIFLSESILSFNMIGISPYTILKSSSLTQTRFIQQGTALPKKLQPCFAQGGDGSSGSVADIKSMIESVVQNTDSGIFVMEWLTRMLFTF
jgi:hypothetical protein